MPPFLSFNFLSLPLPSSCGVLGGGVGGESVSRLWQNDYAVHKLAVKLVGVLPLVQHLKSVEDKAVRCACMCVRMCVVCACVCMYL